MPIDSPSGAAMKPVAMPPAVAASDERSPVPSSLTGRLKTISDEDVALLERRVARQRQLRHLGRAGDVNARFDAGVGNLPRRPDVEQRIDVCRARESDGAVPHEIESAALKVVGAADGIDGARRE